jgi:hypothetical protein
LVSHELERLKSQRTFLAVLSAAAALVALCAAPSGWSHSSSTPARLLIKVHARIRIDNTTPYNSYTNGMNPRTVFFTPALINVGTVILDVVNSDDDEHRLTIDGVTSRMMGPDGGKAVMRVTFKKPGTYGIAVSADNNDAIDISGELKVVK